MTNNITKEEKTLTITVNFSNGIEMEDNLNKAIDEIGSVIKKKGLINMRLVGVQATSLSAMYEVDIKDNGGNVFNVEKINAQLEKLEYAKSRAIAFAEIMKDYKCVKWGLERKDGWHRKGLPYSSPLSLDQLYEIFNQSIQNNG